MDRLESLSNTISNLTMYDIKSMYTQAKNVVLNVSEMEAKVREATNDDPWGASSTLMQEIAQGTFSFQYFNEVMPSIYSRFMEKEARQWRQIYKALQLLEYLIKHGSERVVDDARSHISTIKMLRNFHYIDDKGKDEGINVRNRAKELVELLSDVEKIRAERRKAKANKSKYVGVGNDGFGGGSMSFDSGGGRYGGFGNDTLGGGSSYGNGNDYYASGSGSSRSGGFSDTRRGYEEYTEGDAEVSRSSISVARSGSLRTPTRSASTPTTATQPPPPPPVEDLLGDFGDDSALGSTTTSNTAALAGLATNKALPAVAKPSVGLDDDDFADFQAAPVQNTGTAPALASTAPKPNLMTMLNAAPRPPVQTQMSGFGQVPQQPAYGMGMGAGMGMHRSTGSFSNPSSQYASPIQTQQPHQNVFGGTQIRPTTTSNSFTKSATGLRPTPVAPTSATQGQNKPAATANFDDLWSLSIGGSATAAKPVTGGKSIKDLEKEKSMAGLWGAQQHQQQRLGGVPAVSTFDSFAGVSGGTSSGKIEDADDLLL